MSLDTSLLTWVLKLFFICSQILLSSRYEELRYWYDCLCYEEELRQYHDYIAAIEHMEDKRYREVGSVLPDK